MVSPAEGIRVCADTSVFGGAFDEEFRTASRLFFEQVRAERFRLVTSALVSREVVGGPPYVRQLFDEMERSAEVIEVSGEALRLRNAYLRAGVVTQRSATDALHVALATVGQCRFIVSWNFRDIVHYTKIAAYNTVNADQGYRAIGIFTPAQVVKYEDEDV